MLVNSKNLNVKLRSNCTLFHFQGEHFYISLPLSVSLTLLIKLLRCLELYYYLTDEFKFCLRLRMCIGKLYLLVTSRVMSSVMFKMPIKFMPVKNS